MKVKDLIEELKLCDARLPIVFEDSFDGSVDEIYSVLCKERSVILIYDFFTGGGITSGELLDTLSKYYGELEIVCGFEVKEDCLCLNDCVCEDEYHTEHIHKVSIEEGKLVLKTN